MSGCLALLVVLALDGGVDAGVAPNDAEVIEELELLENFEGLSDLELLRELEVSR